MPKPNVTQPTPEPAPAPEAAAAAVNVLEAPELPPLLEPTADSNPRLTELEAALGGGSDSLPGEAPSTPATGDAPKRPGFKRWSKSQRTKASRRELAARVAELEGLVESTPAPAGGASSPADSAPALSLEDAAKIAGDSLAETLRVASGVARRMRGAHWELTDEERKALGDAWGPVLAPYLGNFARHLPLVAAVSLTASVVWPRIERDMELAKLSAAAALPTAAADAPAAE